MRFWKMIKAISPLIATIILVTITITGGLIVYALFSSSLSVGSAKAQVNFESAVLIKSAGQATFAATIKNSGNKPATNLTLQLHENQALSFDGVDDYVEVPDSDSLDITNKITVGAWIYNRGTKVNACPVTKGRGSTSPYAVYWFEAADPYDHNESWTFWATINGRTKGVNGPYGHADEWVHVVGTYDGSYLRFYFNGELYSEVAVSGNIDTTTESLFIGYGGWNNVRFNGTIDEVYIYNRALSDDEISGLYQGIYNDKTGLVLYLPFDGDCQDQSGQANHGTNHGATFVDAPEVYVFNGALQPGMFLSVSTSNRVNGPRGKFVVGNQYLVTVDVIFADGSTSSTTTTITCSS